MLVLTRKQSETIHIGEDIIIKVIQTGRGSIKLGIDAPSAVRVMRGEVAETGDSRSQASTRVAPPTLPASRAGEQVAKWHTAK